MEQKKYYIQEFPRFLSNVLAQLLVPLSQCLQLLHTVDIPCTVAVQVGQDIDDTDYEVESRFLEWFDVAETE